MVHHRLAAVARKHALPALLWVTGTIGATAIALAAFLWIGISYPMNPVPAAGITFSPQYAESLGLDWHQTLTSLLDDLRIRNFRIPAYWSVVEPEEGTSDWSEPDEMLDEIANRNGSVTLAIGAKLPRWPECWMPEWARNLPPKTEQDARIRYLAAAVTRYRNHPAVKEWQVENEPFFAFGICPPPDRAFFKREVALVRSLDPNHPIATTDSGELSTWIPAGMLVDKLGVSTYRVVVTPTGAIIRYLFIPPFWYLRHALLIRPFVREVYVSEFQMEPWADVLRDPLDTQFKTFSPDQMSANFDYADRMGFESISFWGAEWWYWVKTTHGDSRFWDLARNYFQTHP